MRINGIGTIKKSEAMSILTREGRKAVKAGEITLEELGRMYKLSQVKNVSALGTCADTFQANYDRIPEDLKDELTPDQLGRLVDAFYQCYGDGKNEK